MKIQTLDLLKKYGKRTVVDHVNIEVEQGTIVGLLGPNGAGKTTTFYIIAGIISPDGGEVYVDEVLLTHMPMHKRCQFGISYLPQEASVFKKMTVWENLISLLETRTDLTENQKKEKAEQLLTEIARALTMDPAFILLDEPFAGVDPLAVEDIQSVIKQLKTKNIGILITDHNVRETLHIVDEAYILSEGKVLLKGTAEDISQNPIAKTYYLGENFSL